MNGSVRPPARPSARPSVCHTFLTNSCHRTIIKILGVATIDKSDVHAQGQGPGSKVKVPVVEIQFRNFRTVTPVSIHICLQNYAQS